ncbi:hypothetical protein NPX13_g3921 [Xylaria arbuscula]|uniref:Lytic polysaccharide monooxygenase n=1 Tax=Xylaria arbuscula TaxID=114810 RepID=A0A9W8NGE3_9PEZI|nr:hypothetical protein NPX13_g3921 [Xylaria arbuscula]
MPSFKSFLLTASLASLATAHIALENPKPYKLVADGATNPLMSNGADFPCRIPAGQSYIVDGEPTDMVIGEDQTLSFSGHAVHGGGSCQLALSPGHPTKDSSWMVIHSIEGGCPARKVTGNLDGEDKDKYTFRIPEGIKPGGNWTLAWTWHNRGGSAEMYMACAPINILPSNKKRMSLPERRDALMKRDADFPELFIANLGEFSNGCSTAEAVKNQISIAYPNPGLSIEQNDDNLFKMTCDGNPRSKPAPSGDSGDDNDGKETETPSSSPAPSSSSASSSVSKQTVVCPPLTPPAATNSTVAATTATTPNASTSTPTTLSSVASSASATLIASSSDNEYTSTTTLFPVPSASTSTLLSASPSMPSEGAQCIEGHLTCLDDGRFFATCTGGQLTAHQPIAPGYKCAPGSGVGLDTSPI